MRLSGSIVLFGASWVKQIGFVFYSQDALVCVHSYLLCQLQVVDHSLRKCSSPLNFHVEVAVLLWQRNMNVSLSSDCTRCLLRLGAPAGKLDQILGELRKGQKLGLTYIHGDSPVRFNVVALFCLCFSAAARILNKYTLT